MITLALLGQRHRRSILILSRRCRLRLRLCRRSRTDLIGERRINLSTFARSAGDRGKDLRYELYVMPAAGGDAIRLTRQAGTWPRWSPRGDGVVFTSNGHGNEELVLLRVPAAPAPPQQSRAR